jgi:adhesin/invasin
MVFLFAVLALSLSLFPGCEKDKVTGPGGGSSDLPIPDQIALSRDVPALLANGVSTTTIFATVVDAQRRVLEGAAVYFVADRGLVEPFATTDQTGVASTAYTSAASAVDVTARITAQAFKDTLGSPLPGALVLLSKEPLSQDLLDKTVEARRGAVRDGVAMGAADVVEDHVDVELLGITLTVTATPSAIPADGISASQVRARLVETTSKVPLNGESIRFGATGGAITGRVATDATGTATATLTSTATGAAGITVYYGDLLTATTNVSFSALNLTLTAAPASLVGDGKTTTTITARLISALLNPIVGVQVRFTTSLGSITGSAVTDESGEARATLRSSLGNGTATVSASYEGASTATMTVPFTAIPTAAEVLLSAEPGSLPADGASEAALTARVLDAGGNPVPDGTAVVFSVVSGGGNIVGPNRLTTDGMAEAIYVAGTTSGLVNVRAVVGSVQKNAQVTLTRLGTGSLTLTSLDASVIADGLKSTTLTAVVKDALGNPVVAGTAVSFQTSLGAIEDVKPTDASGIATAKLRPNRFITGTARVTAAAGGFSQIVDVKFVSEAATHIVVLDVNEPSIGVVESASPQVAQITFEVRDRNGIPVDRDHAVSLAFVVDPGQPPATDAVVNPASATTNERGRAVANVQAGRISGAIEVRATSGALVSRPIRVAIHGDLPDPSHFSIAFQKINIAGLVYEGIRNQVTAHVADQWGNPVPDSTVVWFSSDYGIVQGSGFTDDFAEAVVWEVTSAPYPTIPGGDGLVTITAQTMSKAGVKIETSGDVMWSGHTIAEFTDPSPGTGFTILNAGSKTFTFQVRDANNNPLTSGTKITVETTVGNLAGDTSVELPDTQSSEYTTFYVTLSDDTPDEDLARPATITVKVVSQNGNRSATITGTLN